MRMRFFSIPALDPEAAQEELNRFLGSHRIVTVERQLAQDGMASFWAIGGSPGEGSPVLLRDRHGC